LVLFYYSLLTSDWKLTEMLDLCTLPEAIHNTCAGSQKSWLKKRTQCTNLISNSLRILRA